MKNYRILIVDDCEFIQEATDLMLESIFIDKILLERKKAFSAKEAIDQLKKTPDIEIVILDLSMEHNESGLEVIKFIREELNNKETRIILRTGKSFDCHKKIEKYFSRYDINDLYEKSELNIGRFHILIMSSIRSYERIQEIKKQQKMLLKERLENTVKNNFFNLLSHEINTPLNGIVANLDLMDEMNFNNEQRFVLENVKNSVEGLQKNLQALLNYSNIKNKLIVPNIVEFNLNKLIYDVLLKFEHLMKEKGLRFYYSNKTNVILLKSDPAFLEQILVNLLSNAIKYTERGFIELMIDKTNKKELRFSIKDTGIGIEESKREKVFKEMVQADGSIYSRNYEGIGLGIPIVSGFLESLGGHLDFASTVDVGSTFWFTIPLLLEEASIEYEKIKRILYVEDNKVNQMVARKIIEKLGYVLDVADNGEDAIRDVKIGNYDLILMDYSMPVMNGAMATKWIRENVSKEMPIIGVTAFMEKELIDECINSGMNEVIHKPFRLSDIKKVFSKYQF